jgi:hypothetical protein
MTGWQSDKACAVGFSPSSESTGRILPCVLVMKGDAGLCKHYYITSTIIDAGLADSS